MGGNGSELGTAENEEQMGWSAAPSTQSIWNLLCFLFETLKDVDWSFCLIVSTVISPSFCFESAR